MRRFWNPLSFALVMCLLLLSGCGINGYEMNGVGGHAREEYLKSIKPYGAHWVKEGMTRESRRADSWACGAAKTVRAADHVVFTSEQRQKVRTADDKNDYGPDGRLLDEWRSCMTSRSYTYLEQCDDRCMYP